MRYSISSDETNKETLCVDVKRQDKKIPGFICLF